MPTVLFIKGWRLYFFSKFHKVGKEIQFIGEKMIIFIDDRKYNFFLNEISGSLLNASKNEREYYQIDSDGYGVHWPLIDEDLSIDGLLGIRHYSPLEKIEQTVA